MNVSRRKLLQVLPAAAAVTLEAQDATAPSPAQTAAAAELEGARQYLRIGAQVVRQVELPMATEPALRFVPRN